MRYKKIGDMDVSVIAVGTWAIGASNWGDVDKDESIRAIHAMIDNGVNLIDTAPVYGFGHSEEVVGEAIKGKRDQVFSGHQIRQHLAQRPGRARACATTAAKTASARWRTRCAVWAPTSSTCTSSTGRIFDRGDEQFAESMGALEDLKNRGKIRHIGLSNHDQHMIEECMKYGTVDAIQPPVLHGQPPR